MRRSRLVVLSAGVLLGFALIQWAPPVLGSYLVDAETPRQADAIFVLGGDHLGDRILTAAKLAKEGYAPRVYVSGPSGLFDYHESDLSIPFAQKRGYDSVSFVPLPNDCKSTRDEAQLYMRQFRTQGLRSVLVVTSNYHTRRAGRILRQYADGLTVRMIAAPCPEFRPEDWWHRRQDQKTFFMEWSKAIASWMGI